jgi:hypothetical protein
MCSTFSMHLWLSWKYKLHKSPKQTTCWKLCWWLFHVTHQMILSSCSCSGHCKLWKSLYIRYTSNLIYSQFTHMRSRTGGEVQYYMVKRWAGIEASLEFWVVCPINLGNHPWFLASSIQVMEYSGTIYWITQTKEWLQVSGYSLQHGRISSQCWNHLSRLENRVAYVLIQHSDFAWSADVLVLVMRILFL